MTAKAPGAMRTIGEVAVELGVPTHVLRFWEARFPEVAPLTVQAAAGITARAKSRCCARSPG